MFLLYVSISNQKHGCPGSQCLWSLTQAYFTLSYFSWLSIVFDLFEFLWCSWGFFFGYLWCQLKCYSGLWKVHWTVWFHWRHFSRIAEDSFANRIGQPCCLCGGWWEFSPLDCCKMRVENQHWQAGTLRQFKFPLPAAALEIVPAPTVPWFSWTCFDHVCLLNASPCEAHFSIFDELEAYARFQLHHCKLFLTNLAQTPSRPRLLRWYWDYVSCYSPELWQAAQLRYRWCSPDWYMHWGGKRLSWILLTAYLWKIMKNKMIWISHLQESSL